MAEMRRIKNDWVGWNQVTVVCMSYFLDEVSLLWHLRSLQDSVGWRLVAADNDYFYLERKK